MANEKRLIDANGIKYREHMECYGHGWFEKVRTVTKKEIDKLPTVDAVEVVRCWECKYGDMCSIREAMAVSDWNAYCFRGERRTDGNS